MSWDEDRDETRLKTIENQVNRLADLVEMLAKERHRILAHAKPFGEFAERDSDPATLCNDPICREAYDAANRCRL